MTEGKNNTELSNDPLDDDEAKQHKILERQLGESLNPRTFRFCKELFVRFHSAREIGELRWKDQILKWEIAQRRFVSDRSDDHRVHKMTVHELRKFVSDRSDDYRVYNWREVEGMREDLARVSMGHSELAAKVNGLSQRLFMVHRVLAEMRDAKAYEWADRLRDALEGRP